ESATRSTSSLTKCNKAIGTSALIITDIAGLENSFNSIHCSGQSCILFSLQNRLSLSRSQIINSSGVASGSSRLAAGRAAVAVAAVLAASQHADGHDAGQRQRSNLL